MDEPQVHGFMPKGHPQSGHPWASRDYADIDCKAVGCVFNVLRKCSTPSLAKIGDRGQCEGFTPKPEKPPEERTGD